MVVAYHAIFAAYGFWLANEERGSWSTEVWAPRLREFGPATKTTETKSLAYRPFDHNRRRVAQGALKYPAVNFTGAQARAVARGVAEIIDKLHIPLYAFVIMPNHAHLVSPRHDLPIEEIVGYIKRAATRQLAPAEGIHPLAEHRSARERVPSPWVENGWFRYLNNDAEIFGAIDYAWENPTKIGLPHQPWWFLTRFKNWRPKTPRGRGG
jgi:REP element-mobilizing transposase RayT